MSGLVVEGKTRLKKRGGRRDDITPEQIETFFATLVETCNVVRSAKAAGFSANWAYRRRRFDAAFRLSRLLDMLVAAVVEDQPLAAPPGSPAIGSCYIVGAGATGSWSGQDHKLAAYGSGGWRFVAPAEGLSAYVKSAGVLAVYRAGSWEIGSVRGSRLVLDGKQVVGPQAAAIAAPTGGATADQEARGAIAAILAALRQHGLVAV